MTALELLERLRALNVGLWLDGDELHYRAERGAVTASLLCELRERKGELVDMLRAAQSAPTRHALIPVTARDRPLPLSYAQERLWFLEELAPGTAAYNIAAAIPLTFAVDVAVFQSSLDLIVSRHESLRTTFGTVNGQPVQLVAPTVHVPVAVVDLSGLDPATRTAESVRLARDEAGQPFDLRRGPLLRAAILQLESHRSMLLVTMHHIVSDGWSMGIFYRELGSAYMALAGGHEPRLPTTRIQYGDFAAWQRQWLRDDVLRKQVDYWKHQLDGAPMLELPTDRPRPPFQTFNGAALEVNLSSALTASLRSLARDRDCTLFMVLLAGFAAVLSRYTAQNDIVIGTYNAGRNRAEMENVVGFFVNTLALRVRLDSSMTFGDLVDHVRDVTLAAYDHQDLPFPRLIEELELDRDLSRNPVFQTVFHLFNAPTFPQPDDTPTREFASPTESASFDVVLNLMDGPQGLFGQIDYNTDLFDASTVERLVLHFTRVLEQATAAPDRRVSTLALLSEGERDAMLALGRGPVVPLAGDVTLVGLFEQRARADPGATAFTTLDGDALTYGQLQRRSGMLAVALRRAGVRAGAPVGVYLEPSFDLPAALLAVFACGAAYLPLDRSMPVGRVGVIIGDAAPPVVITDRRGAQLLDLTPERLVIVEDVVRDPDSTLESTPSSRTDLAYILYTSGSTGSPKGVAVEHAQVLNRLQWMWRMHPFGADERSCVKTSIGFVDSLWELLGPLLAGSPSLIVPPTVARDPDELVDALSRHRVTRLWLVPSLLRVLLDGHPDLGERLPALTFWVLSGEELSGELAKEFLVRMPGAQLYNLYGTSEVWDATWTAIDAIEFELAPVPIGRPIDNVRTYVLDGEGSPVPVGVVGELHVGGLGVARGYLGQPELTRASFVPDPFGAGPNGRLYRTGDLSRWRADGQVEFIGRRDHQIQVRGMRVELGEIEAALRSHHAVADAAVVPTSSDGVEGRLDAYVVLAAQAFEEDSRQLVGSHVQQWSEVWDEVYGARAGERQSTSAFVSSYTGAPMPAVEVEEWIDNAVRRVLEEPHRRILEIGCGNGLLLSRLAAHCEVYVGTDLSSTAIDRLAAAVAGDGDMPAVTLHHRAADDFDGIPSGSFDVVVLHSVAQYFPSMDYLERVLIGAVTATAEGGVVLVGDVPCLGLLERFHRSVERFRRPGLAPDELDHRVLTRAINEKELWVDPEFFSTLPTVTPGILGVEIRPKRGRHRNEFTRFRCDVVLRRRTSDLEPSHSIPWSELGSLDALCSAVRGRADDIVVTGIPNARLVEADQSTASLDPDEVDRLAEGLGAALDVRWSNAGRAGDLDLICRTGAQQACEVRVDPGIARPRRAASRYGNNPLRAARAHALVPVLREHLAALVPEQMIPAQIVIVPALPVTSSGKVDRVALTRLHDAAPRRVHAAPQTVAEEVGCAIWADVLGIDAVGVHDHFFNDLGGHSLLAVRAVARLREAWRTAIPLRMVFESPTIAGLLDVLYRDDAVRRVVERASELYVEVLHLSAAEVEHHLAATRPTLDSAIAVEEETR